MWGRPGALTTAPEVVAPTQGPSCSSNNGSPSSWSCKHNRPSAPSRATPTGVITETARGVRRVHSKWPLVRSMHASSRADPTTRCSSTRNIERRSIPGTSARQLWLKRSLPSVRASGARVGTSLEGPSLAA